MLSVASRIFELGFCLAQLAAVLWRRLQVADAGLRTLGDVIQRKITEVCQRKSNGRTQNGATIKRRPNCQP